MIGAKPIEAGCTAIIIPTLNLEWPEWPEWTGKIVKVLGKEMGGASDDNIWNVMYWFVDIPGELEPCGCAEPVLLRIDDPEIQQQIESEQELVIVR